MSTKKYKRANNSPTSNSATTKIKLFNAELQAVRNYYQLLKAKKFSQSLIGGIPTLSEFNCENSSF